MNQNPTDDVRKEDVGKLPVLKKDRDPAFSKEHVHVMFILGIFAFAKADPVF